MKYPKEDWVPQRQQIASPGPKRRIGFPATEGSDTPVGFLASETFKRVGESTDGPVYMKFSAMELEALPNVEEEFFPRSVPVAPDDPNAP